jgi:hypothetical protein
MTSSDRTTEPMLFGVPGSQVRDALLATGLPPQAIQTMLARGYAESASAAGDAALAPQADSTQGFQFQVQIAQTAPECVLDYQRKFVHQNFVEGVTVVQAEPSPDDPGFNLRFHAIEAEFDAIAVELLLSSNCVAELRRELFELTQELAAKITEIDGKLNAKPKDKDSKETKEKDSKETKEGKEKDTKEGKDKEHKDGKEHKEKEHKEDLDKALPQEKLLPREQINAPLEQAPGVPAAGVAGPSTGTARAFISLEDRPDVGSAALQGDDDEPAPPAPEPAAAKATSRQRAPRRPRASRPRRDQDPG